MSKYSIYDEKIKELILIENSNSKIAQILLKTTDSRRKNKEVDTLRTYVSRYRNKGIKDALNSISVDHVNAKHLWHEIKDDEGKKIGNAFIKNPDLKTKNKQNLKI